MASYRKDPDSVEKWVVIWCDESNLNTGAVADGGDLQGETISTIAAQVPAGLTLDAEEKTEVTVAGITYAVDTTHSVTLSGGTAGETYSVTSRITTSGGRTLDRSFMIICREL